MTAKIPLGSLAHQIEAECTKADHLIAVSLHNRAHNSNSLSIQSLNLKK